ncbi:MAG: asparagine synthase (glutamine-hydrolyzing) [Acidobacteria bacterium]|nr:MAG: asparagine synthase (glutamine-hydrolyzing) [Acidobacteriota bacterium]
MCGIAGIAGEADELVVKDMLARIRHRGPDDTGIYATPRNHPGAKVAMGNNRLSILDLSPAGHQPTSNEDGTVWVAYNGEIYNFAELRQELENDGHRFLSHTDTEILPHLYEKYGPDMVNRLNGMFAFALWDGMAERLWLFRDRMGVKPLYYVQVGSQLYFASEIKALLACPEIEPALDVECLPEYLALLYVPNPQTMFKGIFKLSPGYRLLWEKGRISVEPYWKMRFGPLFQASEEELSEQFHEVMVSAVRRQLISDVPIGFFLSGGLDSSALVACAAESGMSTLRCYSIAFRREHGALEQSDEDSHFARVVADRFGAKFESLPVEPEVATLLPKAIWHMDEPVADHAAIATYLICRAAKPEVTVLLSGQGADEVLGGYRVHLAHRLSRYLAHVPGPMRRTFARNLLPFLHRHAAALPFVHPGLLLAFCRFYEKLQAAADMPAEQQYSALRSYYAAGALQDLLSDEVAEATTRKPLHRFDEHFADCAGEELLNKLLYVDCKTFLPDLNLTLSDKMSMAHSIEARVPFLDNEVVDFLLRVPPNIKIKRLTQKYLLRRAFRDILPSGVLRRRKAGFGLPIRSWLQNELRDMVHDMLSEKRVRERGLLQPAAVSRMIEENMSGRQDHTLRIWALLTLELWQQTFLDNSSANFSTTESILGVGTT